MQSDASSVEVVAILSELLSPEGIPTAEFASLFLLCNECDRVMPRVGQANHRCLIDVEVDSGLEDDLRRVLGG